MVVGMDGVDVWSDASARPRISGENLRVEISHVPMLHLPACPVAQIVLIPSEDGVDELLISPRSHSHLTWNSLEHQGISHPMDWD